MATFVDDNGKEVKAVTAEQHALDNPGHIVTVMAKPVGEDGYQMLEIVCHHEGVDHWWDEQGHK